MITEEGTQTGRQLGPERTARRIAEHLFALSGVLMVHRDTGCRLDADDVRRLVRVLDTAAADAGRLAGEIAELAEMICDLADAEAAPVPARRSFAVIEGGRE